MTPNLKDIQFQAKCELARRDFFAYCNLMAGDFYKPDRQYLVDLCGQMQQFLESDDRVLIVNAPPRHGKSRTAGLLVQWALGKNPSYKIMTGSYNETLSTQFSKVVRNAIQEEKADKYRAIYTDVFPGTAIQRGDGAMNLWSLVGQYNSYLATSPTGTATGFGCDLLIIDDVIKNAQEAYNENVKSNHWDWFSNTMLSRLEENGKIVIIMTRWATDDLAGRALRHFTETAWPMRHITLKAVQDDGSMLCPEVLSYESYREKIRAMGRDIAAANYQQEPIDIRGRLYSGFKTYTNLPADDQGHLLLTAHRSYTDTADTGSDYLCHIAYGVYQGEAYVTDVIYTQQPMEITERQVADSIRQQGTRDADIESNNGGRGFARSVQRYLDEADDSRCSIHPFHQSANKQARILSNASWCMEHIYFPVNWMDRWPDFADALMTYQREGKNTHDDAPDALTGVCEKILTKRTIKRTRIQGGL